MLSVNFKWQPGDVLVSAGDIFPDVGRLNAEFDILDFMDLCAALETVVLCERLVCVNPNADRGAEPIITPLFKSGVLCVATLQQEAGLEAANAIIDSPAAQRILGFLPNFVEEKDFDVFGAITGWATAMLMDFVLQEQLKKPLAFSAHSFPIYTAAGSDSEIKAGMRRLGTLLTINKNLKDHLKIKTEEAEQELIELEEWPLLHAPPVALEILSKAETLAEALYITLQTRQAYAAIRKRLLEYDLEQQSGNVSRAAKLKAKRKLKRDVRKLIPEAGSEPLSPLGFSDMEKLGEAKAEFKSHELGGGFPDWSQILTVNPVKALPVIARLIEGIYVTHRLGPLHATKKRFLDLSSKEVNKITLRFFSHELTKDDLQRVSNYHATIEKWKTRREQFT